MWSVKLAAPLVALFSLSVLAHAQPAIQPITAPAGAFNIAVKAMNNNGQVVGYYSTSGNIKGQKQVPFMWDGTLHILPDLGNGGQVNGINDAGQMVGTSYDLDLSQHAVIYTLNSVTDLGYGDAEGLNNSGNYIFNPGGACYVVNITTGAMTQVADQFSNPGGFTINANNQVAGSSEGHAWVDLGSGNEVDLSTLLPGIYFTSSPVAIGPNGEVAGAASGGGKGGSVFTDFLWDPINGMQLSNNFIWDFNNLGDSIGNAGDGTATFWHNGTAIAINDLIGPGPVIASQGFLVNDLGKMVITVASGGKAGPGGGGLSYFDPSLVVNLDPSIIISGDGTFDFDGNPHAASATVTGYNGAVLSPAPTITYDPGGTTAPTQPGTYQVTASFPGAPHYNSATATSTIVIQSSTQPVTVGVQGGTFIYDGTAHPALVTVTDASNQPVPVSVTVSYSPGGSNPPVTPGTYGVTASFAGDANYSAASSSGTIVINNATLIVTANSLSKTLNAPLPTLTGSMSGAVSGDGLSVSFVTTATQASPIGQYPITPVINDPLGRLGYYNVSVAPGTLKVVFAGNSGVLQPINADGSSVFKQGSTVPVKVKIYDANGVSVSTPGTVASFDIVQIVNGTVSTTVNEPVSSTTPDSQFRWDGSEWIFNISTKGMTANQTYYLQITLADGSTVNFRFGLK